MRFSKVAIVYLCTVVFGVLYLCLSRPSLSIGKLRWVYRGANISVIRAGGKDLVGPGFIELHVSSNFVYGVVSCENDLETRWFAIRKDSQKVYVGESPDHVERMLGLAYSEGDAVWPEEIRRNGLYYKTFQSQRESEKCRGGWTWW